MIKQGLQQKLLQKLSPQQIQFIKLLQLNTVDFLQRVEQELIENPALLKSSDEDAAPADNETLNENNTEENEDLNKSVDEYLDQESFDVKEYVNDEYDPEGFHLSDEGEEEKKERPLAESHSFYEELIDQYNAIAESEKERIIGNQIIGSLDDDGYLRRDINAIINDLAFSQNIDASAEEMKRCLHKIQTLEPAGIGATSLQECLLLQLKRKKDASTNKYVKLSIAILEHYFEDFLKKHYDKLVKSLKISEEDLKLAVAVITKLNPKPGEIIDNSSTLYIIPDFILTDNDGEFSIQLNNRNAPDLRVSKNYLQTLKGFDETKNPTRSQKETVQFIKQKLDGAKWFIESIKQRQNTLLLTMNAILKYQYKYFTDGDETKLKPMILKDVAAATGLDISTISRVANSKYIQTNFGIIPLKFFFSEGIVTDDGEEVSSREVKKILSNAIGAEDKSKPLPDEKLMEILKEKGYNIARRTVAKYREQLNIPVARLRKEL